MYELICRHRGSLTSHIHTHTITAVIQISEFQISLLILVWVYLDRDLLFIMCLDNWEERKKRFYVPVAMQKTACMNRIPTYKIHTFTLHTYLYIQNTYLNRTDITALFEKHHGILERRTPFTQTSGICCSLGMCLCLPTACISWNRISGLLFKSMVHDVIATLR